MKIELPEMDPEKVSKEVGDFVLENIIQRGTDGCVLGISGGVDSTVTASLIRKAFSGYNLTHPNSELELVGYVLPSSVNNPADTEGGIKVANKLKIRYEVHEIDAWVEAAKTTNPEIFTETNDSQFHRGNLMSEIRATVLHRKAASEHKILAGTGNKEEDFGLGYYTLFGDGAVHISPIGNLPKRLVRQMAQYFDFVDIANKEPSAGLEPGQTDFKDIGYSYDLTELVLEGLYQLGDASVETLATHFQIAPLVEKEMKQYENIYGKNKFDSSIDLVTDIMRRHATARHKARLVSPRRAPITLIYNNIERRIE